MRIVHITTVHQRFDSRIFYKECLSLKREFRNIFLIVADGKGDQEFMGINIIDVGAESSRLKRLLFASARAIKKAKKLNANVYHIHDPELLIFSAQLCKYGHVVFDSHEDFPKLMLQRPYIPAPLRKILFAVARNIEKNTYLKLSGVVTATENIRQKFMAYGDNNSATVKNYPVIDPEESKPLTGKKNAQFTACYVGGLTPIRGVEQMILACEQADVHLILAGPFDDETFFQQMKSLSGWKNVEYLGVVPHGELKERVYDKSDIGLNMLLAAPNHTDSIPIKQLEYMAHGLPVVATKHINFCIEVTQAADCGILVTPEDTQECAKAIRFLKDNKEKRIKMGENGRQAVVSKYNWNHEEEKLIEFYRYLNGI